MEMPSAGPHSARPVSSDPASERRERTYVNVGDVVADKYRVERLIGEGGMAFVVQARHLQLDEPVALKFLRTEFLQKAEVVERFSREARAACRIKSEYVARVYDVGSLPGNVPYLVMEYLEGKNLDQIVQDGGGLEIAAAVEYTMQACEALAVAHAQGIVHRDIKPDNLFLVAKRDGLGEIKVLDFGISKLSLTGKAFLDEPETGLTGALALGTPLYMSPEQIRSSRSVDHRSDIWSLGVVLYELLTAKPAFDADSITEVCAAILESDPVPLGIIRTDVPSGLEKVIERALQKDPAKRYQNVAELAIALLQFAPKRARLSAERSSSVIRAAHPSIAATGELVVPSSIPPPLGGSLMELGPGDVDIAFDRALKVPLTPSEVRRSQTALALKNAAAADALASSLEPNTASVPARTTGRGRRFVIALSLVMIVGAAVAFGVLRQRQAESAVDAARAFVAPVADRASSAAAGGGVRVHDEPATAPSAAPPTPAAAAAATGTDVGASAALPVTHPAAISTPTTGATGSATAGGASRATGVAGSGAARGGAARTGGAKTGGAASKAGAATRSTAPTTSGNTGPDLGY